MTSKFQAGMFDLDGTLLDTIEDLAAAMNFVLAEEGLPTPPVEEHKFFVGDGIYNYMARALPPHLRNDRELVESLAHRYRDRYGLNWQHNTIAYDGIGDMLAGLQSQGVRLAVLSNKPHNFTCTMVTHFFGDVRFEVVRGARAGCPLKPDPAAALEVASEMKLSAESFLYVGDTDTDMQTARAAGMFAVGALWGFRPREELERAGAKAIIEYPPDILKLL